MEENRHKIRYDWLKEKGICVQCGQNDAFDGRVRCADCLYINNERSISLGRRKRKEKNEYQKDYYRRMKEECRCVKCGKPAYKDYVHCQEHHIKMIRQSTEKWQRKKKGYAEQGLCLVCGAERVKGKKFCPIHYEQRVAQMEYARQFQDRENNHFVKYNKLVFNSHRKKVE